MPARTTRRLTAVWSVAFSRVGGFVQSIRGTVRLVRARSAASADSAAFFIVVSLPREKGIAVSFVAVRCRAENAVIRTYKLQRFDRSGRCPSTATDHRRRGTCTSIPGQTAGCG